MRKRERGRCFALHKNGFENDEEGKLVGSRAAEAALHKTKVAAKTSKHTKLGTMASLLGLTVLTVKRLLLGPRLRILDCFCKSTRLQSKVRDMEESQ